MILDFSTRDHNFVDGHYKFAFLMQICYCLASDTVFSFQIIIIIVKISMGLLCDV